MKAKVVLAARLNTTQFPTTGVSLHRSGIKFPIMYHGQPFGPDDIIGYYARYPHVVGNCLFPGCTGTVERHVQPLGKDHSEAFAQYQRIERDFCRVREGKLPMEEPKVSKGRSIEESVESFLADLKNKQRKFRTIESYEGSLRNLQTYAAEVGLRSVDQIDKKAVLGFLGWLEKNLERRQGGHPNNTYRNKLKDVGIFLGDCGIAMPLKRKEWPHEVKGRKEKYSTDAVKGMLKATAMKRHQNNAWSPEDDKDLIHFLLKTGFRDEEIAHAQYSDINFENGTVNVTAKPRGSFPGLPDLQWTPKDNEARAQDIVVGDAFLKRMKARKARYDASASSLIFPNKNGKPNAHLIRVIKRLAAKAGVVGRIGLHKFRKTFATMVANEDGIEAARILLGHSDIATTQKYLAADEVAPEQSRKTINKRYEAFGD
jgi:integrase